MHYINYCSYYLALLTMLSSFLTSSAFCHLDLHIIEILQMQKKAGRYSVHQGLKDKQFSRVGGVLFCFAKHLYR